MFVEIECMAESLLQFYRAVNGNPADISENSTIAQLFLKFLNHPLYTSDFQEKVDKITDTIFDMSAEVRMMKDGTRESCHLA